MRRPEHRRANPKHHCVVAPPLGMDLEAVAARVRYVGSVYHKDLPSFAPGSVPRPRPHASICPRELAGQQDQIQMWLQGAIRQRRFGALWEGGFPRYVWHREGNLTYEARLVNQQVGEYKGYPLEADDEVQGLP